MTKLIAFALLCLLAAGCNDNNSSIRGLSPAESDKLGAEHSRFEKAEDPPFKPETHFAAGQLAETQNSPELAIRQYEAAVKLDPGHLPSLFRLGVVHAQLKQYPQSIDAWERYIKAAHGSASGYANLGFTHELAGNPKAAAEAYQKGVKADPTNQACRLNYGLMLARQDREEEAIRQMSAVLKPAEVHYNLGSLYEQQAQLAHAREHYQMALELDPKLEGAKTRLTSLGR